MRDFTAFMEFLIGKEQEHRKTAAFLASVSRGDEANFEKIQANVYGIFKAVLETALKKYGEGGGAEAFFAAKLRGIPSSWRETLASAAEKGDSESAHIEKLKLQAVSDIEKAFKEAAV